jgi:hypothetical protein
VGLESIIVRLRIASSFMERLVMRTPFQPEILQRVLPDHSLERCPMVEQEFTIVLSMEVSCLSF